MKTIEVTAWTNGKPNYETGSGFGIRIKKSDRDLFFFQHESNTSEVSIETEFDNFTVQISGSFWNKCHELRSPLIGKWIVHHKLHIAPKGQPNKMLLERISKTEYKLYKLK